MGARTLACIVTEKAALVASQEREGVLWSSKQLWMRSLDVEKRGRSSQPSRMDVAAAFATGCGQDTPDFTQ